MWIWGVLVACAPRFELVDPTCDADYLPWAGELTQDVLQGSGNGEFAYAPSDSDIVSQVAGRYSLVTGEFDRRRTYVDSAYRTVDSAVGAGTLWPDGDLDLEYDLAIELPSRTRTVRVRDRRLGCEVDRRVDYGEGRVDIFRGTLADDALAYTHEWVDGARVLLADGVRQRTGEWTETLAYEDANLDYQLTETGNLRDGSWRRDLDYSDDEVEIVGFYRLRPNGRTNVEYTATVGVAATEVWDYDLDPSGDGSGTLTFADTEVPTCTLQFVDGACEVSDCDAAGPCVPPLVLDEVLVRF